MTTLALFGRFARLVATIVSIARTLAIIAAIQFARRYAAFAGEVTTFAHILLGSCLLYHGFRSWLLEKSYDAHCLWCHRRGFKRMQVGVPGSAPNTLTKYGEKEKFFLFASAHKTVPKG
jgi:hypothetical protein